MLKKLSQRDKRTLLLGGVTAVIIVGWSLGLPWLNDWRDTRLLLTARRQQLKLIAPGSDAAAAKAAEALALAVPVFEMPQPEKTQSVLFRDRFTEQLKKAGIKVKTLEYTGLKSAKRLSQYKVLRLQCKGTCQLNQAFDLLAALNENPWLVGVEEFLIKCDPKNRQNVDLTLTVSTFAK
ncbi:MAG: hypothetical protein IH624_10315 [Phycisphaerae bacterium]|nr:hypothetical protein [Phycisphaerae bacterium]